LLGAVGADEQSAAIVEVADGAFDDPAVPADPGAVAGLAAGDRVAHAAGTQQAAVLVVVIATVGDQPVWAVPGPAGAALDVRDLVQQRHQLGDVVAVGGGRRPGQQEPAGVGQDVMLDARPAPVDRAGPEPAAPFFACT